MITNCINWLKILAWYYRSFNWLEILVFNSIVLGIKHNIPIGLDNKKYS